MVVDIAGGLVSGGEITYNHYHDYHHYLLHGWPGAVVVVALLAGFGRERWRVVMLCLLTFHLHLLCDLIGSRGPAPEDLWPIAYSEPFFRRPVWIWNGQWKLDGWQNEVVSIVVFALALGQATRKGRSFIELFGHRLDSAFVRVLQKWRLSFGMGGDSN